MTLTREEIEKKWDRSPSWTRDEWISEVIFNQPVKNVPWIGKYVKDEKTGHEYVLPCYSTNISAAWTVLNKTIEMGMEINVGFYQKWDCALDYHGTQWNEQADTAPEAICKTALLAVLGL
ncbi:BC1872 family protein [Paenibacillus sp. IHBB 3054]|uniref:BC1872 family protein n=1 Tax=Paenibacillus sp. IHBB 3054 TaxID=3425689 RepID=UPI003F66EBFB